MASFSSSWADTIGDDGEIMENDGIQPAFATPSKFEGIQEAFITPDRYEEEEEEEYEQDYEYVTPDSLGGKIVGVSPWHLIVKTKYMPIGNCRIYMTRLIKHGMDALRKLDRAIFDILSQRSVQYNLQYLTGPGGKPVGSCYVTFERDFLPLANVIRGYKPDGDGFYLTDGEVSPMVYPEASMTAFEIESYVNNTHNIKGAPKDKMEGIEVNPTTGTGTFYPSIERNYVVAEETSENVFTLFSKYGVPSWLSLSQIRQEFGVYFIHQAPNIQFIKSTYTPSTPGSKSMTVNKIKLIFDDGNADAVFAFKAIKSSTFYKSGGSDSWFCPFSREIVEGRKPRAMLNLSPPSSGQSRPKKVTSDDGWTTQGRDRGRTPYQPAEVKPRAATSVADVAPIPAPPRTRSPSPAPVPVASPPRARSPSPPPAPVISSLEPTKPVRNTMPVTSSRWALLTSPTKDEATSDWTRFPESFSPSKDPRTPAAPKATPAAPVTPKKKATPATTPKKKPAGRGGRGRR